MASRSLRRDASTVASSWIEGAKAFCGIECVEAGAEAEVEVVVSGGGLVFWYSGGACLERDSEEKELVSLEVASLLFESAGAAGGMLTEANRRSSSSRLRAQSFM